MTLHGKNALVSGGGTGIGQAIAQRLASEGAEVTITRRCLQILQDARSKDIFPAVMDVTDETSVYDTIAAAVAARGPIQICVANAGIAEGRASYKTDLALWKRIMATNLDGTFLTIRDCFKLMRGTDWGRVIAVASIAGVRGLKGAGAYSASKHGVIGLIRSFSEDHMNEPFTFNAVYPGNVDTPIIEKYMDLIKKKGLSKQDAMAIMVQANRHARLIGTDEIVEAALWLCANGSQSVNGQTIEIAGGKFKFHDSSSSN